MYLLSLLIGREIEPFLSENNTMRSSVLNPPAYSFLERWRDFSIHHLGSAPMVPPLESPLVGDPQSWEGRQRRAAQKPPGG